ncbi:AI-2E family transporter [Novosphingobium flavum]|uniref:AI-2E family transporter n=1 Tax=Novosphingobium aerophilum TaxID=2839843 RepID=A0A7X1KB70_9SPHN|nr:AI-2E family transporter [Novosphingobium aerophilum]MBC2650898.1 AI-2E family transporter [Novosphingobium aerophilum]MBC2663635.1 AI-2E family transporter [Novosphingobium aerophilum]
MMRPPTLASLPLARVSALLLLTLASLAFVWLVTPFAGAILWAVIATILFEPLYARVLGAMPRHRNRAALVTLLTIVVAIVVPAILLGAALIEEATNLYARLRRGDSDVGRILIEAQAHLPAWLREWLAEAGLSNPGDWQSQLGLGLSRSVQTVATQLLSIGQGTLGLVLALGVMLYLTFFLLRDGRALAGRIERAIPLPPRQRALLMAKFVAVIRATVKGSLVVAVLQGLIGGIIFWLLGIPGALLWGAAMGVFSLFPAIGTGIVWVPVALYLLITGAIGQAAVLGVCGLFVIGTVDNIVRPVLVGHDARMPDYVVLIATLSGFELMGFNGFIIGPMIAGLFIAMWEAVDPALESDDALPADLATGDDQTP